jgi:hypothetical protein
VRPSNLLFPKQINALRLGYFEGDFWRSIRLPMILLVKYFANNFIGSNFMFNKT